MPADPKSTSSGWAGDDQDAFDLGVRQRLDRQMGSSKWRLGHSTGPRRSSLLVTRRYRVRRAPVRVEEMTPTFFLRATAAIVTIAAAAIAICLPGSVPAPKAGADALVGAATAKSSSGSSAYSAASFPLVHLGPTAKRCNYIVGYRVNESALVLATGAPDSAARATVLAVIKAAVADLSSRTGQPYRYDGTTTFAPTLEQLQHGTRRPRHRHQRVREQQLLYGCRARDLPRWHDPVAHRR